MAILAASCGQVLEHSGWPGSSSRQVTATMGSSGLISPLNLPILFLFFPGILTGRSSRRQISSKIKSGINYLSTYPSSWWLYGFASLHLRGRVLALLLKHTHLTTRRAESIKCSPFVFALFTVLDSKEPWHCSPNDCAQLQHCRDSQRGATTAQVQEQVFTH